MTTSSTRSLTLIFSCLSALTLISSVPARAAGSLSAGDKAFVMKAAQGGMTEIQLGQLAADHGTASDVKDFGAKMVKDHGNANIELMSITSAKGIKLPDTLDTKHQRIVDSMKSLSVGTFDKTYVDAMVAAHSKDNALFQKEATSGKDAEIEAFAAKTDEMVKMHLSMIEAIQSKMK
jgi:putative membrane protein